MGPPPHRTSTPSTALVWWLAEPSSVWVFGHMWVTLPYHCHFGWLLIQYVVSLRVSMAFGMTSILCCSLQVLTQTGITWNLSPVGKVMPKEWRESEEWRDTMRPINQTNCCTDEWQISACSDNKTLCLFQHVSLFNKLNMILLIDFLLVCHHSDLGDWSIKYYCCYQGIPCKLKCII